MARKYSKTWRLYDQEMANEMTLMNFADIECQWITSSLCRSRGASASKEGVLTPKFLQ